MAVERGRDAGTPVPVTVALDRAIDQVPFGVARIQYQTCWLFGRIDGTILCSAH